MIPTPKFTLIDTSLGGNPAVVVVNSALLDFWDLSAFPWHLSIEIDCRELGENGMPTHDEMSVLEKQELMLTTLLVSEDNSVFLARITGGGKRRVVFRVFDPEVANEVLSNLVAEPVQTREWDYVIRHDPNWELAQPELRLLSQGARTN